MANFLNKDVLTSKIPTSKMRHSRFPRRQSVHTTMTEGMICPITFDEVVPGDMFEQKIHSFFRIMTPLFPTMDDVYVDVYTFYAPFRILWNHFEEFEGANKTGAWVSSSTPTYQIPQYRPIVTVGSVGDYLGLPLGDGTGGAWNALDGGTVSALPFRFYRMIYNEYFRRETVDPPVTLNLGDTESSGVYDQLLSASRAPDYFSLALPAPQRSVDPVTIPLGELAPVVFGAAHNDSLGIENPSAPGAYFTNMGMSYVNGATGTGTGADSGDLGYLNAMNSVMITSSGGPSVSDAQAVINNAYADLAQASGVSINALRLAFATQRIYEKDARAGGGRYVELVKAHFNVDVPNLQAQRPEYLGGYRVHLNMEQVLQTSSTDSTSPLGQFGGVSRTKYSDVRGWRSAFTERGLIMTVAVVRTERSYQEGVDRFWTKKDRFDFYYPSLANIGEQPVYDRELMANQINMSTDSVFGYQEAWAEYRQFKPNKVTGLMRSGVTGSLDAFHYADYYNGQSPTLSSSWMAENGGSNDDHFTRTLAVQDNSAANQIYCDFAFDTVCTRPMPLYSVPGLIDHY